MSAKHKLNTAHFNGCLILSGIIGIGCQSFLAFFVALAVCIGLAVHSGGIRR